jgi:hypothetical protein
VFCLANPGWVRATIRPALLAAATLLVSVLPLLALVVRAGTQANLAHFHIYYPTEQYKPLHRYLFDSRFHWGAFHDRYTVQLDLFYVVGCLFLWAWLGRVRAAARARYDAGAGELTPAGLRSCLVFTAVAFAGYFALQTPLGSPFYRHVPGASYVQFPWRLLCFLSPLLVCLFAGLSRWVATFDARLATRVVLLVSAGTIGLNATRTVRYDWHPRSEVEDPPPCTWEEYWPVCHRDGQRLGLDPAVLASYAARGAEVIGKADCQVHEVETDRYMEHLYEVRCGEPCVVALPVAYSGMEALFVESDTGSERIGVHRTDDDPRVRFVAPPGEYRVRVKLPTAARAFATLIGW